MHRLTAIGGVLCVGVLQQQGWEHSQRQEEDLHPERWRVGAVLTCLDRENLMKCSEHLSWAAECSATDSPWLNVSALRVVTYVCRSAAFLHTSTGRGARQNSLTISPFRLQSASAKLTLLYHETGFYLLTNISNNNYTWLLYTPYSNSYWYYVFDTVNNSLYCNTVTPYSNSYWYYVFDTVNNSLYCNDYRVCLLCANIVTACCCDVVKVETVDLWPCVSVYMSSSYTVWLWWAWRGMMTVSEAQLVMKFTTNTILLSCCCLVTPVWPTLYWSVSFWFSHHGI